MNPATISPSNSASKLQNSANQTQLPASSPFYSLEACNAANALLQISASDRILLSMTEPSGSGHMNQINETQPEHCFNSIPPTLIENEVLEMCEQINLIEKKCISLIDTKQSDSKFQEQMKDIEKILGEKITQTPSQMTAQLKNLSTDHDIWNSSMPHEFYTRTLTFKYMYLNLMQKQQSSTQQLLRLANQRENSSMANSVSGQNLEEIKRDQSRYKDELVKLNKDIEKYNKEINQMTGGSQYRSSYENLQKFPESPNYKLSAIVMLHLLLMECHEDLIIATQHPNAPQNIKDMFIHEQFPERLFKHAIDAPCQFFRQLNAGDFADQLAFRGYHLLAQASQNAGENTALANQYKAMMQKFSNTSL